MNKLLVFVFLLSGGCTGSKLVGEDCTTMATVKDFTGLDGCRYLLVLDNGDKYLPVDLGDSDFQFQDNQRVRFGYQEVPDAVSICMAEDKSVKITCIQEIKN